MFKKNKQINKQKDSRMCLFLEHCFNREVVFPSLCIQKLGPDHQQQHGISLRARSMTSFPFPVIRGRAMEKFKELIKEACLERNTGLRICQQHFIKSSEVLSSVVKAEDAKRYTREQLSVNIMAGYMPGFIMASTN
jgi:hypothetical protein